MKFTEAMDFIEECNKAGIVPGLDSIKELCKRVGNPQDELRFIHIAGTNGKGSTLAYMSTILKCAGYRTGRYISPTIVTYLERFQVNGKVISQKLFAELAGKVKEACDAMTAEGFPHPTAFEVETAIAFLYFLEKRCDIVVLECGMGGREDATNLIKTTFMEVFAHIDMDHMQFLGETLEAIAAEKAGIIKPHTVVVSGKQHEIVYKVLQEKSKEQNAKYTALTAEDISKIKYSVKGQSFEYCKDSNVQPDDMPDASKLESMGDMNRSGDIPDASKLESMGDKSKLEAMNANTKSEKKGKGQAAYVRFTTPLLGTHQVDNAATAVLAMKTLDGMIASGHELCKGLNKRISDGTIQKGLLETTWQARLQIVGKKPLFIIDGAHNPDAALRLKESMDIYFQDKRKIFIMGMFRDKAVRDVIDIMCPLADMVMTIATPNNPRAMSAVELAKEVSEVCPNVTSLDSVEEAMEMAKMFADKDTVILAFGSLSFLGRIIENFNK